MLVRTIPLQSWKRLPKQLYATMTSNSVYGRFLANIGLQDKRACWEKVFETHTIFLSDYYVSVVTSVNI